jgi:Tat protein translocase TatB subunit
MFEVGFSELLLIMGLALLVLGPEKLPKVVGEIGRWMGRARAMARQFREQLEIEAQETARRQSQPASSTNATTSPSPTTRMVILPFRLSESSSTVPPISASTAGSFGLRASKTSVTRGRPPTMSALRADSFGVCASIWPAFTVSPSFTSMRALAGRWWKSRMRPSSERTSMRG